MMEAMLDRSWISYQDQFLRSELLLTYPKNIIFTAQLLAEHLKYVTEEVYPKYPSAEKFNVALLNEVDWSQAVILVNRARQLLIAPEPVKQLVNLDKRLRYKEAAEAIFDGFRFFPQLFDMVHFRWIVFLVLVAWLVEWRIGIQMANRNRTRSFHI